VPRVLQRANSSPVGTARTKFWPFRAGNAERQTTLAYSQVESGVGATDVGQTGGAGGHSHEADALA
jgi:hypothetical protein